MPFRYSVLRNPSTVQDEELEASFDSNDSDVEDTIDGSRPLNRSPLAFPSQDSQSRPRAYNFENLEYDYPPPGSPPRPSAFALPNNDIGNSNGRLPQVPQVSPPKGSGWIRRTAAAMMPSGFFGVSTSSGGAMGGGVENDGVFANLNAKPGRGRVVQDGESGIYVVPEEVQRESPPSYASAQADAVPPYWETTILAPTTFGSAGEMMVDGLPTGSVFSFLWNLLVSMSFQFVGFLFTFLLHSTHAAKLGSRAGLGITLIRFGFYLRSYTNYSGGGNGMLPESDDETLWSWPASSTPSPPKPTFDTAAEAEDYYAGNSMATNNTSESIPSLPLMHVEPILSERTAEWLSFLLMTLGWFILLTSTLTFWRVKRWERSIIASTPTETPVDDTPSHAHNPFHTFERFGFPGAMWHGVGFNVPPHPDSGYDEEAMLESDGDHHRILSDGPVEDIEQAAHIIRMQASNMQLHRDLRDAGLL